jgi:hypothetical protein
MSSPHISHFSYCDPGQNAAILNGARDMRKSQTWAYRYKRAEKE